MDFELDPDIEDYRHELRRFVTKNLAPTTRATTKRAGCGPTSSPHWQAWA